MSKGKEATGAVLCLKYKHIQSFCLVSVATFICKSMDSQHGRNVWFFVLARKQWGQSWGQCSDAT